MSAHLRSRSAVALTLAALLVAGIWAWHAARRGGGLEPVPSAAVRTPASEEIGAAERQRLEQILRHHDGHR